MKKVPRYLASFLIVIMVLLTCKVVAAAPPQANIDTPTVGSSITNSVAIKGWSINSSGVKRVSVYINGGKVGDAAIGIERDDINTIFNSRGAYKGAKYSGFSFALNTSAYAPGTYRVKIISVGNNGVSYSASSSFVKVSPKLHIDYPANSGLAISSNFAITGWSLSPAGVKNVAVTIDGIAVGSAQTGISRADVNRIYNASGCYQGAAKSGFTYQVKYKSLSTGTHSVTVTSYGNDGSNLSSSFSVNITSPKPVANIDAASGKLFMTDTLTVKGWSLNVSGVKSVEVYIGGKKAGNATVGLERDDVNAAMNSSEAYMDGNKSGYTFTLSDTSAYAAGNYTVKIVSTGNDNTTAVSSVTASKLTPKTYIDKPSDGSTVIGDFTVSGWAVNASGVKEVQILVDGVTAGTATTGISRPDVQKAYGADKYKNSDRSGFTYDVSISALAEGSHKITVKSVGNDGNTDAAVKNVVLAKAKPAASIDAPNNNNEYLKDTLTVKGWSVSACGVKSVQVFLDGDSVGSAETGLARPDVNASINAKHAYKDAENSGFSLSLSGLSSYKSGVHTVKIISTGNDNVTVSRETKVYKAAPVTGFDSTNVTVNNSDFTITGWALNATGVGKVELYIGTTLLGTVTPNLDSADIQSLYDNDGAKYSGASQSRFKLAVGIDTVPYGSGTLTAKAYGNDGEISTVSTPINVVKLSALGCIDSPANGQNYTCNDTGIVVSGWALNVSGVKSVSVYLDSTQITGVTTGLPSGSGVISTSAGRYKDDENARFTTGTIDITALSYAKHTVKVVAVGNDGSVYEMTSTIYKSSTAFTKYNISVAKMAAGNNCDTSIIDPDIIKSTDSAGIYEFMTLNYVDGVTADELNKMLVNCGVLTGKGQVFLDAAKANNINPVYLVAHARVESGNGTSKLSAGVQVGAGTYTFSGTAKAVAAGTYYNQFGINAVDSSAVGQGSKYAAYSGWNSVDASITGGAAWIANIYIWGGSPNQDTLYEMRFDPGYWDGTYPHQYEYATSKTWAHSIASVIEQYKDAFNGSQLTFDVPEYS